MDVPSGSEKEKLTETQVKVILILLDNKGHASWELAEWLKMKDSNLSPLLKDLRASRKIIRKGRSRLSKREHIKKGEYREYPYYLTDDITGFKVLIEMVAAAGRPYDTGFLFAIIRNSKYLNVMIEKFKDEIIDIMRTEFGLVDKSPIYDDIFIQKIEPELETELFCELAPPSAIQLWYKKYLKSINAASQLNQAHTV
jgi:hypothetical protein